MRPVMKRTVIQLYNHPVSYHMAHTHIIALYASDVSEEQSPGMNKNNFHTISFSEQPR